MSVNQISQDYGGLWWTTTPHQRQQQQLQLQLLDSAPNSKSLVFAHHFHHEDDEDNGGDQPIRIDEQQQMQLLEVMFEKPLTPSDVGKLNRLVIPKQHAERHFPLNTSNGVDSGGMLLSFEDEAGKLWRFRYSYWNSSQSYVLTKGWSRYVKEKRLDAGDVVVFQRHPTDPDRLFIGWHRRNDPVGAERGDLSYPAHHHAAAYPAHQYQPADPDQASAAAAAAAGGAGIVNQNRTPSFNGSTSSRTLRLFGVNMEYQFESDQSEPATPDGSLTSSPNGHQQAAANSQHYNHFYSQAANYYGMSNHHMAQQDASHNQQRG